MEIINTERRATRADDDLRIGCDNVRPLRRHRADVIFVDAQQEPRPVAVVPLADADELPSAERVERDGSPAQDASPRPESLQFVLSYKRLERADSPCFSGDGVLAVSAMEAAELA